MSAATGALGSLGSDLAFSVSFGIASELLKAASDADLSEEELIGIVLAVSVVLSAVPSSVLHCRNELAKILRTVKVDVGNNKPMSDGVGVSRTSGVLEFFSLLVGMAQRISISICVQLLSSNVRSRQPLRSVRVVSLLAVAIFFLFLESTSSVGQGRR